MLLLPELLLGMGPYHHTIVKIQREGEEVCHSKPNALGLRSNLLCDISLQKETKNFFLTH